MLIIKYLLWLLPNTHKRGAKVGFYHAKPKPEPPKKTGWS